MKKRVIIPLAVLGAFLCVLLVFLSRLGTKAPARPVRGEAWSESWEVLGSVLGVQAPEQGFSLLDNTSILTVQDTYLATWVSGEPMDYETVAGDETQIYDAQLFVLLQGCKDNENAQMAVDEWMGLATENYDVSQTASQTHNGQEYTVITYTVRSDTNPYDQGMAAYGVFENYAVSAELTCLDTYTGDIAAILSDFLDGCHYADTEG